MSPTEAEGFPPETGPLVLPADGIAATRALAYPVSGYAGGWRDSALSLAMRFEARARDDFWSDHYRMAMRHAAELARQQATDEPCEPNGPGPVSPDPADRTDGLRAAPDTMPLSDTEGMSSRRCAWCRHWTRRRQWSSWGWLCRKCINSTPEGAS